jgi:hypothetical protein
MALLGLDREIQVADLVEEDAVEYIASAPMS